MKVKNLIFMLCFTVGVGCIRQNDYCKIRHLVNQTFSHTGVKVEVDTIVVVGNYALDNWRQGNIAGRCLFKKQNGNWVIWLCGGKGLKEVAGLVQAGIPADTAQMLSQKITDAESTFAPEIVQKFDDFGATINMSEH
ncbi:copper uptake system-associated protein [Chitinophaga sp. Mgbs1]|uniref:Copper uptake system-associated protein n=1 Tax=Chitinophaga solisilvae TaxID=1233460 RepID=A0A433W8N8_9BACT|nr:copper uptake system-associated protein [Chitinophaga solisilvae]